MPKYTFVVNATISLHTDVEAATLEEAVDIAKSRGVQSLCHQCAHGEPECWNTSGELDCGEGFEEIVEAWKGNVEITEEASAAWE